MFKSVVYLSCAGILSSFLTLPAFSQTSTSAEDLILTPRVGVGVTSSGGGTPSYSQFDGFVPLLQTPGESVLFLEGHLLWLDYETVGSNLVLGQRFVESDRIWGGYVSYDTRDTGNTTFHQLGLGLEHLSDSFDFRLNGYFPIGTTREQIGEGVGGTNSSFNVTDYSFQGNNLILTGQTQTESFRQFETAMLGVDGEVGGKLTQLGDIAQLRGYGGLYYYDGASDTVLGWRARLEAIAQKRYTIGLAVQDDNLFGTNFIVRVGVALGGSPTPSKEDSEETPPLYRMEEFVSRNNSIVVKQDTEIEINTEDFTEVALNPDTGEAWFFQHVGNSGTESGDGTFESPFGLMADAIAATNNNGSTNNVNEIIYVQPGDDPGIPAFTIPDNIQVLSTGPTQQINTQRGQATLPLSGAGTLPTVNGTVTLGSNNTLSGFNITGGLTGNGVNNGEILNNTINSDNQAAILLENTTGTINFISNTVTGTNQTALSATNIENVNFTDGSLTSNNSATNGLEINTASGTVSISNSPITVDGATNDGVALNNISGNATLSNSNTTISNSGNNGISMTNITGNATLSNSPTTVSNSGNNGFTVSNVTGNVDITNSPMTISSSNKGIYITTVSGNATLSNSAINISDSTSNGIEISSVTGDLTLDGGNTSTISNSGTSGIYVENLSGTATISGFTITDSTDWGILAGINDGSTRQNLTIENNTITNVTNNDGILVGVSNGSGINSIIIQNNNVSNTGNDGIAIGATGGSTIDAVTIDNNTVDTVQRFGIGVGVDTANTALGFAASNNSTISSMSVTNNTASNGGQAANTSTPGANFGVAIQSNNSSVCFSFANNILTNPPNTSLGGVTDLQVYLQNGFGNNPVPANFKIVGGNSASSIQSNNNNFTETVQMYRGITFTPFVAPATLDNTNSANVTSCP